MDIQIKLLNAGVQPTWVEPEIRGRVHVFDQDFTHPPELRQIESSNVTRSPEQDSQLPRNERITFLLRQHLTPAVAEVLRANAGEEVRFDFAGLRVGLIFRRWSADEDQDPEEKRDYLRLGSYAFRVPERP